MIPSDVKLKIKTTTELEMIDGRIVLSPLRADDAHDHGKVHVRVGEHHDRETLRQARAQQGPEGHRDNDRGHHKRNCDECKREGTAAEGVARDH